MSMNWDVEFRSGASVLTHENMMFSFDVSRGEWVVVLGDITLRVSTGYLEQVRRDAERALLASPR